MSDAQPKLYSKDEIAKLDEGELRRAIIIPLLKAMGYEDVEEYHGGGELGKDIVCWKADKAGDRVNTAVVVKRVPMTGKAAVAKGTVGEIQTQVLQCLGEQYDDPRTGEKRKVDRVLVIADKPSKREFISAFAPVLRGAGVEGRVEFWNGDALWDRYRKHVLSVKARIEDLMSLTESLDPNLSFEYSLSGSSREIRVVPKPGAEGQVPLRIGFENTPEGEGYRKQLEELFATGKPITLPGKIIEHFGGSDALNSILDDVKKGTVHLSTTPEPSTPMRARVEFCCDDGDQFTLEYAEFVTVRRGTEEAVLSNRDRPQSIPLSMELLIKRPQGSFNINFKIKYPLNAYQLHRLLQLQKCLTKPFSVQPIDLETGLAFFPPLHLKGSLAPAPPDFVELAEDLFAIQLRVGRPIVIPDRDWTDEEENTVAKLRTILHEGGYDSDWEEGSIELGVVDARKLLETSTDGTTWLRLIQEESEMLFDMELPVGRVEYSYHVRIADEGELRERLESAPPPAASIRILLAQAEEQVKVRYLDWPPHTSEPSVQLSLLAAREVTSDPESEVAP